MLTHCILSSLLIFSITTVGYGHLQNPETPAFQLYTVFFVFIGIATLTIMVAQVYQCIALEASRAQHSRDQSEMAHRGMDVLTKLGNHTQQEQQQQEPPHEDEVIMDLHLPMPLIDRLFRWFDRSKTFFRENEFGRGLSVLFPFAGLILIGVVVVGPIEGWGPIEALYFSVISLTTVGFGDYYPTRPASVW